MLFDLVGEITRFRSRGGPGGPGVAERGPTGRALPAGRKSEIQGLRPRFHMSLVSPLLKTAGQCTSAHAVAAHVEHEFDASLPLARMGGRATRRVATHNGVVRSVFPECLQAPSSSAGLPGAALARVLWRGRPWREPGDGRVN